MSTLSRSLESARKQRGLSKKAYAALLGISRQALYGLLAGARPGHETYLKLVRLGDLPPPPAPRNGNGQ